MSGTDVKKLANKKQTAKKPNKTSKKPTVSKSTRAKRGTQKAKNKLSPRIKALLYFASALISLLVIFVPGAPVWESIRGVFYGFLGICIILIPILFIYLAVITTLEKTISHFKIKVAVGIAIIVLAESGVYLLGPNHYLDGNFFNALGNLFLNGFSAENRFLAGGGLFSGIVGYPMLVAFGWWASLGVVFVLLITLILIICKISLNDIGRAAMFVGREVSQAYERSGERFSRRREHEKEEPEFDVFSTDDFDTTIDIPIDNGKKKRRRRKSNIDISIDDDRVPEKPSDNSDVDRFMDAVNNARMQNSDSKSEEKPAKRRRKPKDEVEYNDIITEENTYKFPPVGLLKLADNSGVNGEDEMRSNAQKLISTLESFGVSASITHISRGPSVTRYELHPAPGVKINKITNLSDDIALNLAANGIRIEAPIPGKAAVGIEVPNKAVSTVSIRELIDSDEFEESKSKLTCVLGKDITGKIITTDIAKLPHLLIAGTTGSGKSVCVNSLLISILFKASPDEVKLVLIDPKMVEFSKYKGVPHLLVPVVSDVKKAAGTLSWAVSEMQDRYKLFAEFDCKDIDSYNRLIESNIEYMKENPPYENEEGEMIQPVLEVNGLDVRKEKLPRIVIAIDELADLMMTAPGEVEDSIVRLAQLARAAGMHLVIATQRPTANVITGLIKSNVPSRIALKVGSNMDSRIILDTGGAEKLIGRGDMLYMPVGAPNPIRVQGCFATDDEIGTVTRYVKKSATAQYNEEIEEKIKRMAEEEQDGDFSNGQGDIQVDAKMEEAIKYVCEAGQASTSMLQRRLHVGYARAGRMIDDMEQLGVIGPHQGSKPREVIMTYGEWLERNSNLGE
ncbi:MAG: DNA translocase FtsK [Ruminococcus sp.]|nr:DNA translocase FtsK [Ruminococcus sp.]